MTAVYEDRGDPPSPAEPMGPPELCVIGGASSPRRTGDMLADLIGTIHLRGAERSGASSMIATTAPSTSIADPQRTIMITVVNDEIEIGEILRTSGRGDDQYFRSIRSPWTGPADTLPDDHFAAIRSILDHADSMRRMLGAGSRADRHVDTAVADRIVARCEILASTLPGFDIDTHGIRLPSPWAPAAMMAWVEGREEPECTAIPHDAEMLAARILPRCFETSNDERRHILECSDRIRISRIGFRTFGEMDVVEAMRVAGSPDRTAREVLPQ